MSTSLDHGLLGNLIDVTVSDADGSMCRKDINTIKQDILHGNRSDYAIRMLDSEGKTPSGILQGNFFWPGNFDECLAVQSPRVQGQNHMFSGQYCIVKITSSDEGIQRTFLPVIIGTCFPDSCSSEEVRNLTKEGLTYIRNKTSIDLKIERTACHKERQWTKGTTAALSVFVVLLCFVGVGTLIEIVFIYCDVPRIKKSSSIEVLKDNYDEPTERTGLLAASTNDKVRVAGEKENKVFKAQRCRILSSFSLITNTRELLSTTTPEGHIKSLDGLRVLSMWWIILGNTFVFIKDLTENRSKVKHLRESISFLAVENASFAEDTFFLISGLLVAYVTLKKLDLSGGKTKWPLFLFHRLVRLTPAYACVLVFYSALFLHTLSGPITLYLSNTKQFSLVSMCYDTWWANLLYVNNFYPNFGDIRNQCLPWSWYLACNMQFYLICPFLIWFLYTRRNVGLSIIGGLVASCIFVRGFVIVYFDMNYFTKNIKHHGSSIYGHHSPLYNKPYTRIAPFLVGMALGYLLHKTKCKLRLKKIWVCIGWLVVAASGMLILYGPYQSSSDSNGCSTATSVMYGSLSRPAWSVVVAWVVLMCNIGYGGPIQLFLSHRIWTPAARLTFCAYLVHPMVIYYHLINSEEFSHYTDVNLAWIYMGNLAMSYGMSYVLSMTAEVPFLRLQRLLSSHSL